MFLRRHYQLPLVACLFVLASLACGSYSRASQQIVSTATPPAAEVIFPTATPVAPATYLGDQVEMEGYTLGALTVENPATRPGVFYQPQPGTKLIAVEIVVGNVAGEQFNSNPLYATLVDADGFLVGAGNTILEGEMEMLEVNPGERVRGWVGFIILEGSQPAILKYEINGVELTVGLAPRP